jgi:hypothetical protein
MSFARVAGYLLLELYDRRMTLSDEPASSLVSQLLSRSEEGKCGHDVVFEVGKWHHDYLLRRCASDLFSMPFGVSVSPQFVLLPRSTPHPLHTLRVPPSTRGKI